MCSNYPSIVIVGTPSIATVNIVDVKSVTVVATDPNASELASDTGAYTITLSSAATFDTIVTYTMGGTATAGTDYSLAPLGGTVTFVAGTTSQVVTLTGLADAIAEPTETAVLTLTGTNQATVIVGTPSIATVNIVDVKSVTVVATDPNASELASDTGAYTITLSGAMTADTIVTYPMSGTATTGTEYSL